MRFITDKRNSRLRILLVFFFCVLTVAGSLPVIVRTAAEPDVIRVGYYENEVFQEGAEPGVIKTGYAYEYYRKISEYTGWNYEYVYGGFSELYEMLETGEIDLLAGLAYRPERAEVISYPDAIMGKETYYLVKHDRNTAITADPQSMNGTKIGVLNSAMVEVLNRYLKENHVSAEVITFADHPQLLSAFDTETIDVLAAESNGTAVREHAQVIGSFGASDYYLCVSRKRPDLLRQLNEAQMLLEAEEPHYLSSLNAKYYSVSVTARAFSQVEREWIETHPQLKIGYLDEFLPYSDTDSKGMTTGLVKDLFPALLSSLGLSDIRLSYQGFRSYDELIEAIGNGEIDVVFPVGGGLYYSEESGIYQTNAVVSTPADIVYKGVYDEAAEQSFAVNENNRLQYYFVTTFYPDAEIVYVPSALACLDAVAAGTAGCTMADGMRAYYLLKNSRYRNLSFRQTSGSVDRSAGVKIGNEGLLKLLNRGINVLGSEWGQNMAYQYTDGLYTYSMQDFFRDNLTEASLIVLGAVSLLVFFLVRDTKRTKKEAMEKEGARLVLEQKNRELAASKEALFKALENAKRADRAKTVFLNNMSHDIRTPMNAIVGFTSLAESHIGNQEQVRDYLKKISVSSSHLLSLINDVLDMSRIESGKLTINEAEMNLPEVIHELGTIIQSGISAKQLSLFIDAQDIVHETIISDKLRISQILLNILSNAIKFTPAEGTIWFRVTERPLASEDCNMSEYEFRIRDHGIGMSEEFQKKIFDEFSRERSSTVSGIQGTGLGMAITKRIVDRMNGTVSVTSALNEGSEFIVKLPCRTVSDDTEKEPVPQLQNLHILTVDDDRDACRSLSTMLENLGLRPEWTCNPKEAAELAKNAIEANDPFRAFIVDLVMPLQSGIETVKAIRTAAGGDVPVIMLTAYDWTDQEEEARNAGVSVFCAKPVFPSQLKQMLSEPFRNGKSAETKSEDPYEFRDKTILLTEDNEMNRMIATAILEEHGFRVETAVNGQEAVDAVISHPASAYDAILMDVQMPVMDGYEAAKQIRSLPDQEKAGLPIIAVTANVFEEDRKSVKEAGMDGYLAKPYDIDAILQTLHDIFAQRKGDSQER
ncbi:MAG: response regulator [Solobacterium sp.]|nr:response regulator [Solobacterium sp.]